MKKEKDYAHFLIDQYDLQPTYTQEMYFKAAELYAQYQRSEGSREAFRKGYESCLKNAEFNREEVYKQGWEDAMHIKTRKPMKDKVVRVLFVTVIVGLVTWAAANIIISWLGW